VSLSSSQSPKQFDEEATSLWSAYVEHHDNEARNQIIERYIPLCRTIAATLYSRRSGLDVEFADYLQLGTLGLIEAVDRFDPHRGTSFEAFAAHRIRGSVLNGLTKLSEAYSQSCLRKRLRVERLESLRQGDQVATTKASKPDLFATLADAAVGLALSYMLEGTGMIATEETGGAYRQEFYRSVEAQELRDSVRRLVDALPDRERRVVRYHYYQGLDFTEIAQLLGLTKGRISQIHRQALQLIREARDVLSGVNTSA
jgi:RNA polymerase sigma factor for flagellar operon FliA